MVIGRENILVTTKKLVTFHQKYSFRLFAIHGFDINENGHNFYRAKDFMKNFSKDLKGHATEIINSEKKERNDIKKEMISLTKERKKYRVIYAKKNLAIMMVMINNKFVITVILEKLSKRSFSDFSQRIKL